MFRRKRSWKLFCFKSSGSFNPVLFENLEQRIMLSGDSLSSLPTDFVQSVFSDNNLQIIENYVQSDNNTIETVTSYDNLTPEAAVEQTAIVQSQSNLLKSSDILLESQGLQINLIPADGMSQQAINAFQQAADLLSAMFSDNIVVNINIDFRTLSSGILGSSSFSLQINTYSDVRSALINDQKSVDDAIAVDNLPAGSSLDIYINHTSNNPNGSGSSVPYVDNDSDANNRRIALTTANAKALGLLDANNTTTDASITFNSQYSWDFDRSDGISSGYYDFVGVALHEICHALGFTSGVDYLDENPGYSDNVYTYVSTLDLFRFSDNSISAGADIDWTADARSKFFSIDGGNTNLALFSTGVNYGDGYENGHWKDNLGLGLMDPTSTKGEYMDVTNLDKLALDVIGWDLSLVPVTVQQVPYNQDFTSGLPDSTSGWEYYSDSEGRIQVINGRLRMDDFGENYTYSLNEAILHVDLTGKTNITLTLDQYSLADETTALPAQFDGHFNGDGISLSVDGIHWVTITSLGGSFTNQSYVLDSLMEQAKTAAGNDDISDVRIKFQQYDNTIAPNDGREFDNILLS